MSLGLKSILQIGLIIGGLGIGMYALFYLRLDKVTVVEIELSDAAQQEHQGQSEPLVFEMVTLLPKDAIPAILDPRFASVSSEEVLLLLPDDAKVIGVSIDGESRAYPINALSSHEIVNDVVGGKPIAVTW